MFKRLDFNGNPHLGVFARTNDDVTLIAPFLTEQNYSDVKEALGTRLVEVTIGGGRIVGSLMAMNGRAALVSNLATTEELKAIKEAGLEVGTLEARLNAAGNNVLVNDRAALVHPELAHEHAEEIASLFDVEVLSGTIAGVPTVGMAGFVTNKGLLLHPRASKEEVAELSTFFGVEGDIGTVNHGAPYIGAGLVANTKGAVTGLGTTGVEIGRVEDALKLY
ncbi:MAG: translation initiation factor IF-6 [Euryarchaeota archaeon]|nr:translation initiation factor IF-6 [Euryarchaeota archaeon]